MHRVFGSLSHSFDDDVVVETGFQLDAVVDPAHSQRSAAAGRLGDQGEGDMRPQFEGLPGRELRGGREAVVTQPTVSFPLVCASVDHLQARKPKSRAAALELIPLGGQDGQLSVDRRHDGVDAMLGAGFKKRRNVQRIIAARQPAGFIGEVQGGGCIGGVGGDDVSSDADASERRSEAFEQSDAASGGGDQYIHAGFLARAKHPPGMRQRWPPADSHESRQRKGANSAAAAALAGRYVRA